MACKQKKFPGKLVVIEVAIGCPDELPAPEDWRRMGSMRAKELTYTWDTFDGTADTSPGSIRETYANFLSVSVSGDGTIENDGGAFAQVVVDLEKHVSDPSATGGQPCAWFRITDPRLTRTVYMLINEFQPLSAPYDDATTWSFSAESTASDFGLIVEDTPDPNTPTVASVSVTPATASIEEGSTQQLTATVLPNDAPQTVIWMSSNTAVATVSATGLVTAVAAGAATISVRSTTDYSKVDICDVTVTA